MIFFTIPYFVDYYIFTIPYLVDHWRLRCRVPDQGDNPLCLKPFGSTSISLYFSNISIVHMYIQYLTQKPLVGSYLFWWQHISSILYWYPKIKWFRAFVNDHGYFWPSKSSNMIEHHGINCAHGVPDDSVGVILVTFQPNPRTFCRDVCISSQIYIKIDWCIRNDKYK